MVNKAIELPREYKFYIGVTILFLGIMMIGAGIGYEIGFKKGLNLNPQKLDILNDDSYICYPAGFNASHYGKLDINTDWGTLGDKNESNTTG